MHKRKRTKRSVKVSSTDLGEFKAFLGPLADDYTEAELRQLRREMKAMAEILLDLYLARRKRPEPTIQF